MRSISLATYEIVATCANREFAALRFRQRRKIQHALRFTEQTRREITSSSSARPAPTIDPLS